MAESGSSSRKVFVCLLLLTLPFPPSEITDPIPFLSVECDVNFGDVEAFCLVVLFPDDCPVAKGPVRVDNVNDECFRCVQQRGGDCGFFSCDDWGGSCPSNPAHGLPDICGGCGKDERVEPWHIKCFPGHDVGGNDGSGIVLVESGDVVIPGDQFLDPLDGPEFPRFDFGYDLWMAPDAGPDCIEGFGIELCFEGLEFLDHLLPRGRVCALPAVGLEVDGIVETEE